MIDSIGKVGMNQARDSVSIWRVCIPVDVDRDEYIKTCFLTGTVSLINSNGEGQNRVKIGKMAIQLVDFPKDSETLGSEVVCVTAPYSGKLYVTDVYTSSDEFNDQEENQYRFLKYSANGFGGIIVDGNGKILLSVDGESESDITVSVKNKDKSAKFNINVNGEIMIVNDGKTTIQSTNEIQLEQYDGNEEEEKTFVNVSKDIVSVSSKKIVHNEGEEPILRGNKTVDLVSKLLDFLGAESAGPYPLLGQVNYKNLKNDLEALKSELSFIK